MACTRMSKEECTLDHIHEGCGAVSESVSLQVSARNYTQITTGIHLRVIFWPVVGSVGGSWGARVGCVSGVYWWGECVLNYEQQTGSPLIPDV